MTRDDLPVPRAGEQLALATRRRGHWAVVEARGEIDLATVTDFRGALQELMVGGQVHVIADLTDVSFLDSSGLGALVAAHRRARNLGGSLVLVGLQPPVARIVELTGLERVLRIHPSVQAAVEG